MIKNLILLIPFCFPVQATLLSHVCVSGVNSGTSAPIDTRTASLILIHYSWSTGVITPSDSKTNTQTALNTYTSNGSSQINYIVNPITDIAHTFSFVGINVFAVVCVQAWVGFSVFHTQNGNLILSATTLATNSATPLSTGSLLVSGFHVENSTAAYSIDSGFTISDQVAFSAGVNYGGAFAYKISTDGSAENPIWSCNGTGGRLANSLATFNITSTGLVQHRVRSQ